MMRKVMARTLSVGDVCYVTYEGTDYQCTVRDVANTPDWIAVRLIEPPVDGDGNKYMIIPGDKLVSVLDDARDALQHGTVGVTAITCPHCGYPLELSAHLEKWEKRS